MRKTVTVAIPVYNGEKFISGALDSIINQTRKPDKIVICDNQSDDGTVDIIRKFQKEHAGLDVEYMRNKENIGGYNNYKKCKEICKTDYLIILGCDDRLKPTTIQKHLEFYAAHPNFALVGGNASYINEAGETIVDARVKNDLLLSKGQILELIENTSMWIIPSTIMYNMPIINAIGWWDGQYVGQDERYYPKVLSEHPIAVLKDRLVDFRLHPESDGWKDNVSSFKAKINYFKTNIETANYEPDLSRRKKARKYLKKWASRTSIDVGSVIWKNYSKPWVGFKYWMFGLRIYPPSLFQKSTIKNIAKAILKIQ